MANSLLVGFSNGVDEVRTRIRDGKGVPPGFDLYHQYLTTVAGASDTLGVRKARARILDEVLGGVFESKDELRRFTPAQRRLIWNAAVKKRCGKCRTELTWENFELDHVKPHAQGGLTVLGNARLLCRTCNRREGARARSRRAAKQRARSVRR